jgi:hypothetical protein
VSWREPREDKSPAGADPPATDPDSLQVAAVNQVALDAADGGNRVRREFGQRRTGDPEPERPVPLGEVGQAAEDGADGSGAEARRRLQVELVHGAGEGERHRTDTPK